MSVTEASFRTNFPEFGSISSYPTGMVNFWLGIARKMVNPYFWTDMTDEGVQLFTAHNLVIAKMNVDASKVKGNPGQLAGPTSSKTVGAASVSYDTNAGLEKDAGHWNLSTYGKQFIHFSRLYGAGCAQL